MQDETWIEEFSIPLDLWNRITPRDAPTLFLYYGELKLASNRHLGTLVPFGLGASNSTKETIQGHLFHILIVHSTNELIMLICYDVLIIIML